MEISPGLWRRGLRDCSETRVSSRAWGAGAEAWLSPEPQGQGARGEPLVSERMCSSRAQADNQFPTEFQPKDFSFHTVSPDGLFIMILTTVVSNVC